MSNQEKILIIDGDSSFADQASVALQNSGYAVIAVKTGAEGMKAIFDVEPQLILLDVALTDIDAYEILAKKQSDNLITKIPVFLVSSQGIPINMRRVPAGSVSEFIMAMHSGAVEAANKYDSVKSSPVAARAQDSRHRAPPLDAQAAAGGSVGQSQERRRGCCA